MRTSEKTSWKTGSVDSHAHLTHLDEKGVDAVSMVDAAARAGMRRIVDVGIVPSDLDDRLARYGTIPLVALTTGLHPTAVTSDDYKTQLDLLSSNVEKLRHLIVAIGEAGLDYHWSTEQISEQNDALRHQSSLARAHELPLILHNRDSDADMLAFLREEKPTGVMHCFSQNRDYCKACLDLGMYVSFGGNITYKSAQDIREAAGLVPDDRLLVETDSPYLSPQVVRGTTNHPGHLGFTIEMLAEVRGSDPQTIAELTATNAVKLFSL